MTLWRRLLLLTTITAVGIATLWVLASPTNPNPDVATLNDQAQRIATEWPDPVLSEPGALFTGDSLVVGQDVDWRTPLAAVADRALAAPIVVDGEIVAVLYVPDDELLLAEHRRALWIATATILAMAGVVAFWAAAQHRLIVVPFRRMERFAEAVASGDLDAPLSDDGSFGLWAPSFDLMRTELADAKRREEQAQRARTELIEQVAHDIRTPAASIAATAELLALNPRDDAQRDKFNVIHTKARQLGALVDDLTGGKQEFGIQPVDLESTRLAGMFRGTNTPIQVSAIPECLVSVDPDRMQQVFDNVISNSVKHAGTPIEVTGSLDDDYLLVTIADSGPGVPDDERELILGRGVRGSNSSGTEGQGLGLFTSAQLMERMGGGLWIEPGHGFRATIALPLST